MRSPAAPKDDMSEHDTRDDILNTDGPRVTARSVELDDAIRQMARAAGRESRASRRVIGRPVAIGLAVALALGGGGMAAAAATGWQWHPWAETPDATFVATFPSGVTCEMRLGDVQDATPETSEAIRAFAAENDLVAMADVDGAITEARAAGQMMYDENNVLHPAGPGSPLYNADFEYQMALGAAIQELITEHLRSEGLPITYNYGVQGKCDGADE
jgi:hypothetical protein